MSFVWLMSAAALASSQSLTYTLSIDGAPVGERTVTIRTQAPDPEFGLHSESRIIESWTELTVPIGGRSVHYQSRASSRNTSGRTSFSASTALNGDVQEVQARMLEDGAWQITRVRPGELDTTTLRRTQVTLSSPDLVDPEAHSRLYDGASAMVLLAETGTVSAGAVDDLGLATLSVGGQQIEAHRYAWTPPEGRVLLAWSQDGLLLDYEVSFMGKRLRAALKQLPPPPSFGEFEVGGMGGVKDEEL